MERQSKADHAWTVAAATAHDLNNELTVILSSISSSIQELPLGHPARTHLLDLRDAAERCAHMASGLLAFSFRRGAGPTRVTLEALIEADSALI
ncbi:MAG TPA: hypothetical protein VJ732_09820 [Bryobacteraceae bacterium]|nr:hypothetical protein [Bryobacteraceae bacterium]